MKGGALKRNAAQREVVIVLLARHMAQEGETDQNVQEVHKILDTFEF